MADPKTKDEDQNAIPPETDWPKPNIWPPRQWSVGLKQFISNFCLVIVIILIPIVIIGCIYLLYDIIRTYFDTNNEKQFAELRNSLFILAALIGAPFLIWRTMIASKQANTAQEKAYTELFTQAIEQLGSEKPETTSIKDKNGDLILDEAGRPLKEEKYVPNIEVRVGALYALERIMHDSDKDAKSVIDTLATYVKHNCGKPKNFENEIPEDQLKKLSEDEIKTKRDEFIETLKENPPANRYDIQTALTIIGRRPEKHKTKETMPDLTKVNLQGADLVNFNLSLCDLANAHLEGADLQEAKLQRANLQEAKLQEANLQRAKLQEADLVVAKLQRANLQEANLQGADLVVANLQGANLQGANLQRADLRGAKLQKANLQEANLQKANLFIANLQRADLRGANLQGANLQRAKLQEANLQGANLQLAKLQRAKLQKADLQQANLQGANLQRADLQEAKLQDVQITDAHKTAASVIWVDFTKAKFDFDRLQEQLPDMYGHKTKTILPEGMIVPNHWSEADMDTDKWYEQYERDWKVFKKEKGVG